MLKEFHRHEIESCVVSLRPAPSGRSAKEFVENLGAEFIDISMSEGFVDPRILSPLIRLIKRGNFDVVQSNLLRANLYGRFVAAMAGGPPIICVAHGIEDYTLSKRPVPIVVKAIEKWTARMASAYVAVSRSTAETISHEIGIAASMIRVIPNGLEDQSSALSREEARRRLNVPPDSFVVGSVGRLHPLKGIADLLRAAGIVRASVPGLHVVVVGDGPDQPRLSELTREMNLADMVTMTGARSDVADILPAFDVFAMPSYGEGLPIALLEAMRAGIPAVVTNVGGMPEAVVDGQTGFITKPADAESLAFALSTLGLNRLIRARFGTAARERFLKLFTALSMAEGYMKLYSAVSKSPSRSFARQTSLLDQKSQ
jgi:glycosyltransferase involved in cell wall biosynthesis